MDSGGASFRSAQRNVALDVPGETGLSVYPAPNAAFGNEYSGPNISREDTAIFVAQRGCFSPTSISPWFISVTKH